MTDPPARRHTAGTPPDTPAPLARTRKTPTDIAHSTKFFVKGSALSSQETMKRPRLASLRSVGVAGLLWNGDEARASAAAAVSSSSAALSETLPSNSAYNVRQDRSEFHEHEQNVDKNGGMLTFEIAPTAGMNLLRHLLPLRDDGYDDLTHDVMNGRGNDHDRTRTDEAISTEKKDKEQNEERLRRLGAYFGLSEGRNEGRSRVCGPYGLLDEIVLPQKDITEDKSPSADGAGAEGEHNLLDFLDPQDIQRHNDLVRRFNDHRHLSRHERVFREENGLDLHQESVDENELEDEGGDMKNLRQRSLSSTSQYNGIHPYQTTPLSQGYGTHCKFHSDCVFPFYSLHRHHGLFVSSSSHAEHHQSFLHYYSIKLGTRCHRLRWYSAPA